MEITLAKDVEDFLEQKVREGAKGNPSDLVNDVLRAVRDQQSNVFTATPELEAWLLESAGMPSTPLTKADFESIRAQARLRFNSPSK